jgi:predicted metal-dependent hydrolase
LKTGDFFLVRCGHYRNGDGVLTPRQPSVDALDWVQDPRRFLTAEFVRARVLRAMSGPLPTGEFLTIRRVFNGHRAVAV